MDPKTDYLEINKQSWNNKTKIHYQSDFYDVGSFLKGKTSLNEIELELLGNIKGLRILHLQCHFGQDSISLARIGAKVTGVDLSDKAIGTAQNLAEKTNADCQFICSDNYNLPNVFNEQFDIVFTSYGTIGWLPDINKWADVVARFLKPGGKFVFAEFHPVVWMFDDNFEKIQYRYFNADPIVETENGTYADRDAGLTLQTVTWNHGLGEVVNALIGAGLHINSLNEYDYSPYNCFNNTIEIAPHKFRIGHLNNKIPMVYAVTATKKL